MESVLDYKAVRLDADVLQQGPRAQTQKGQMLLQEKVLNMLDWGTPILLVDFLRLNADARKDLLIAVRVNGNRVNTKYAFYNSLDLR